MPITAENKARYPANWKAIRARIMERAGHKCELCGVQNYSLRRLNIRGSLTRIVLTIAHLDHTPENCADDNLSALCQRCHLAYDHEHHQRNAHATRRNRKACGDLFA